ncbi:865_t:CDS:2, partial [Ambispora leptoticha]
CIQGILANTNMRERSRQGCSFDDDGSITIHRNVHGVAAAYQDDVGLWTNGDLKGHMDVFVDLAKTFEKAGLTFAAKKCFIAYKELNIYGFVISKKKPDNDIQKIKDAIKDMAKAMKDLTKREGIPRQNERNTRLR